MGEILTNYVSDKNLVSRIYREIVTREQKDNTMK